MSGHIRYIEHFTRQYLTTFFGKAEYLQLNQSVSDLLLERFRVSSYSALFQLLDLTLLVVTKGKNGATFLYKEGEKILSIEKRPPVLVDTLDTSGAGDAFFSTIVREYAYCSKIDADFVHHSFELANLSSREILSQIGSRLT